MALSRVANDGANGAIKSGQPCQRSRGRIQRQLSCRTGPIEIAAAFERDIIGLTDLQSVDHDRLRDRNPVSPAAARIPGRPTRHVRYRAKAAPRRATRLAGPPAHAQRPWRHRGRAGRLSTPHRSASRRRRIFSRTAMRPATAPPSISAFIASMREAVGGDADIAVQMQRLLCCGRRFSPRPCSHAHQRIRDPMNRLSSAALKLPGLSRLANWCRSAPPGSIRARENPAGRCSMHWHRHAGWR